MKFVRSWIAVAIAGAAQSQTIEAGDFVFFAQETASGAYGAFLLQADDLGAGPTAFPGDMYMPGASFDVSEVGVWPYRQA